MAQRLIDAITGMREQEAREITGELIKSGTDPLEILEDCRKAMEIIGKRFEEGDCFVPELLMAGEMLSQITESVKPVLSKSGNTIKKKGCIVIGTVQGDIHDIAKNIVSFMLDANGFEVKDLGVDVSPARFVEAVKETGAKIVGLSGFLTMAYDPMKATVQAIRGAGLGSVKIMIGGGQVDEQIREYTGADAFGKDAVSAIAQANAWIGG